MMTPFKAEQGLTLVELLISLTLMAVLSMSFAMFALKTQGFTASLALRSKTLFETNVVLQKFKKNITQNAQLSTQSFNRRLILNNIDDTGSPVSNIYRIYPDGSSIDRLELSTDSGATWASPFPISASSVYQISSGEFLFCGITNNCTRFQDTNGNGVYESGVDAAPALAAGFSGTALASQAEATKILLYNFTFSRAGGTPQVTRTWPNTYIHLKKPKATTSTTLVQGFDTKTANSSFSTLFDVRGVFWDIGRRRLLEVGRVSSGSNVIYQTSPDGILINTTINPAIASAQFDSIALENDGLTAIVLDKTNMMAYRINLNASSVTTTLNLTTLAFLTANSPTAVAFDPSTPTDFYIIGTDSGTSAIKIYERNKTTGAAVANWSVPAGLTTPAGMFIDPITGDFYVVNNTVTGSGASRVITVYQIVRSSPTTTTTFTINIASLGSTAPTGNDANSFFGLSYDPVSNHLFLADAYTDNVYELLPTRLISPQN